MPALQALALAWAAGARVDMRIMRIDVRTMCIMRTCCGHGIPHVDAHVGVKPVDVGEVEPRDDAALARRGHELRRHVAAEGLHLQCTFQGLGLKKPPLGGLWGTALSTLLYERR